MSLYSFPCLIALGKGVANHFPALLLTKRICFFGKNVAPGQRTNISHQMVKGRKFSSFKLSLGYVSFWEGTSSQQGCMEQKVMTTNVSTMFLLNSRFKALKLLIRCVLGLPSIGATGALTLQFGWFFLAHPCIFSAPKCWKERPKSSWCAGFLSEKPPWTIFQAKYWLYIFLSEKKLPSGKS